MKPQRPSMFDACAEVIAQGASEGLSLRAILRRLVDGLKVSDSVSVQALHYFCVARGIGNRRKHKDKSTNDEIRDFVSKFKKKPCADCEGFFHPWAMEFDHRDPAQKAFPLSLAHCQALDGVFALAQVLARVQAEMEKCDLVCANCHRRRTARRRQGLPATLPPPEYHI